MTPDITTEEIIQIRSKNKLRCSVESEFENILVPFKGRTLDDDLISELKMILCDVSLLRATQSTVSLLAQYMKPLEEGIVIDDSYLPKTTDKSGEIQNYNH